MRQIQRGKQLVAGPVGHERVMVIAADGIWKMEDGGGGAGCGLRVAGDFIQDLQTCRIYRIAHEEVDFFQSVKSVQSVAETSEG